MLAASMYIGGATFDGSRENRSKRGEWAIILRFTVLGSAPNAFGGFLGEFGRFCRTSRVIAFVDFVRPSIMGAIGKLLSAPSLLVTFRHEYVNSTLLLYSQQLCFVSCGQQL